ncbi:LTA synthase family protein [Mesobacillus jeotgali]|uniref:LTA synthase family protein n=1 Tax=Mesobacillus jeotgali TaxID=129985 RepID=UPI0009A715AB|nr:LTA synthase family protein [Mesobacillus jeotgali]
MIKNFYSKYYSISQVPLYTFILFLKTTYFYYIIDLPMTRTSLVTTLGLLFCLITAAVYFPIKLRNLYLYLINLIYSLIVLANVLYISYFGSPITNYLFLQFNNLNGLEESIFSVFEMKFGIILLDLLLIPLIRILLKDNLLEVKEKTKKKSLFSIFIGLILTFYYPVRMYSYNPEIIKPKYDANETVINFGILGHHILDSYSYLREKEKLVLTDEEKIKIHDWFVNKQSAIEVTSQSSLHNNLKEFGRDQNLILIQVESLQNFVINKSVAGQEITPNLNKMLDHSVYFPNIYPQTIDGNSSDAEFLTQTSLFPVSKGSVFFRYPHNTYNSLGKTMKEEGYNNIAFHADEGSFWNRTEMYPSIGFDEFKTISDFKLDEEIGMGLSDGSMFRQSIDMLEEVENLFYAFFITLTNHIPFQLPEKYQILKLDKDLNESIMGGYIQSVAYTDKVIGEFISDLNENGLLQNSLIIIYGDHDGIRDREVVEQYFTKKQISDEQWLRDYVPIPLIIYNPILKSAVNDKIGGQIDLMPTIKYLMGINGPEDSYTIGRNLLVNNDGYAILPKGDYSKEPYFIDERNIQKNLSKEQMKQLIYSDLIIRSDYMGALLSQ